MSTSAFPASEAYYNKFLAENIGKNYSYASENIARLHIYYDEIKVEKIQQEKAYEIYNFIAEFGGTVDLFIGFSFFTVFQLVEIAIAAVVLRCFRRKGPQVQDINNVPEEKGGMFSGIL